MRIRVTPSTVGRMPDRNHVHILLVLILVAAAALVGLFMGRVVAGDEPRCRGRAERTWILECLRMNTAMSLDVIDACNGVAEDLFSRACPEPPATIVELDAHGQLVDQADDGDQAP